MNNIKQNDLVLIKHGRAKGKMAYVEDFHGRYNLGIMVDSVYGRMLISRNDIKKVTKVTIKDGSYVITSTQGNYIGHKGKTFNVIGTGYVLPSETHVKGLDCKTMLQDEHIYNDTILESPNGIYIYARKEYLEIEETELIKPSKKVITSIEKLQNFCDKYDVGYKYEDNEYKLSNEKAEINLEIKI